jgi:hypothetical protein
MKAFIKRFYDSCVSEGRKSLDIEKIESTLTVEKTSKTQLLCNREINTPFNYNYSIFSNGVEIPTKVKFLRTENFSEMVIHSNIRLFCCQIQFISNFILFIYCFFFLKKN